MLVNDGGIICIDSGSTSINFARALEVRLSQLTVATNSVDVFRILSQKDGFQIILCGGYYLKNENAFYGQIAIETLKTLNVQKGFICTSAIS